MDNNVNKKNKDFFLSFKNTKYENISFFADIQIMNGYFNLKEIIKRDVMH